MAENFLGCRPVVLQIMLMTVKIFSTTTLVLRVSTLDSGFHICIELHGVHLKDVFIHWRRLVMKILPSGCKSQLVEVLNVLTLVFLLARWILYDAPVIFFILRIFFVLWSLYLHSIWKCALLNLFSHPIAVMRLHL